MEVLRQAILYVILVAAFWGGVLAMKSLSRVQVPLGYTDVDNLAEFTSYRVDGTVAFSAWRAGDAACWRLGPDEARAVNFGWVLALPGDSVAIRGGTVEVNGQPVQRGHAVRLPDCGPVRVPDNHLFVISDHHHGDSIAFGPLPASALRGRLGSLP
jgi:type IV secretory pathway protease TraF